MLMCSEKFTKCTIIVFLLKHWCLNLHNNIPRQLIAMTWYINHYHFGQIFNEIYQIFIFDYKLHYVVDPNAIVFEMSAIASKFEDVLRRNDIMY